MLLLSRLTHYAAVKYNKRNKCENSSLHSYQNLTSEHSSTRENKEKTAHNHNSLRLLSYRYHNSLGFVKTLSKPPRCDLLQIRELPSFLRLRLTHYGCNHPLYNPLSPSPHGPMRIEITLIFSQMKRLLRTKNSK